MPQLPNLTSPEQHAASEASIPEVTTFPNDDSDSDDTTDTVGNATTESSNTSRGSDHVEDDRERGSDAEEDSTDELEPVYQQSISEGTFRTLAAFEPLAKAIEVLVTSFAPVPSKMAQDNNCRELRSVLNQVYFVMLEYRKAFSVEMEYKLPISILEALNDVKQMVDLAYPFRDDGDAPWARWGLIEHNFLPPGVKRRSIRWSMSGSKPIPSCLKRPPSIPTIMTDAQIIKRNESHEQHEQSNEPKKSAKKARLSKGTRYVKRRNANISQESDANNSGKLRRSNRHRKPVCNKPMTIAGEWEGVNLSSRNRNKRWAESESSEEGETMSDHSQCRGATKNKRRRVPMISETPEGEETESRHSEEAPSLAQERPWKRQTASPHATLEETYAFFDGRLPPHLATPQLVAVMQEWRQNPIHRQASPPVMFKKRTDFVNPLFYPTPLPDGLLVNSLLFNTTVLNHEVVTNNLRAIDFHMEELDKHRIIADYHADWIRKHTDDVMCMLADLLEKIPGKDRGPLLDHLHDPRVPDLLRYMLESHLTRRGECLDIYERP